MDAIKLRELIPELLAQFEEDGYSEEMMRNARWVLRHFQKFCVWNGIAEVGPPEMEAFLRVQYDLEMSAKDVTPAQCVVRKPLLALWEYSQTGTYRKTHAGQKATPPSRFSVFYGDYSEFVDSLPVKPRTKEMKMCRMRIFLQHLAAKGLERIEDLSLDDVYGYLDDGRHSPHSLKRDAYYLRETLEWMRGRGTIGFGGRDAFPVIKARPYSPVPSYYTSDEVARMLSCIDTSTKEGKRDMLVVSLLAHYGMRCGDVAKLEFGNIDWAAGRIDIVQDKTGMPLTLPLIDEVKFPLLDYAKNARPESDDPHVLLTTYAPHTPYKDGSSFHMKLTKVIERAGVDIAGRRHGGHALRHSVASGLLEANVPLPTIGAVLGHADTGTTSAYLSIDERRLASVALEVPHVGQA